MSPDERDDAAPLSLDALRTAFLYSKVSKTPVPWDEYTQFYDEVRRARDEFERRDRVQAVRPDLEQTQKTVAGSGTFLLTIRGELGQYDFDRKGFPTGFADTTFVPFDLWLGGPGFAVSLKNGGKFSLLNMEEEQARKLAAAMRECCTYRQVVFRVEVRPVAAEKTQMNYTMRRNIAARVVRIQILRDDQLIGEIWN